VPFFFLICSVGTRGYTNELYSFLFFPLSYRIIFLWTSALCHHTRFEHPPLNDTRSNSIIQISCGFCVHEFWSQYAVCTPLHTSGADREPHTCNPPTSFPKSELFLQNLNVSSYFTVHKRSIAWVIKFQALFHFHSNTRTQWGSVTPNVTEYKQTQRVQWYQEAQVTTPLSSSGINWKPKARRLIWRAVEISPLIF